jgi:hypothetical protein
MKMRSRLALLFTAILFAAPVFAQESQEEPPSEPATDQQPEQQSELREKPIEVPVNSQSQNNSRASRSLLNSIAWNTKNRIGFSLSASEGRISNTARNSMEQRPSMLSAFSGGIFTNAGRHKSTLHFDYRFGYRIYNQQRTMNGAEHNGSVSWNYRMTRKIGFTISDSASSSLNDPFGSFMSQPVVSGGLAPSPSYEVQYAPQRVFQNQARGQINFDFSKSSSVRIFSSYDRRQYEKQEKDSIDAIQLGAGLDQRITGWMSISSNYSTYLNDTEGRLRNSQIHQFELGRFRFKLSRAMEIFGSGGISVTKNLNEYRTQGMFQAGISRFSRNNTIGVNYLRTMITALGYSRILPSDSVTISLGQRLTDRMNLQLSGSYLRSSDFEVSGRLNGSNARAQFEYALLSNLFVSINYVYQNQKNTIAVLSNMPYYNRTTAFLSLQYAWPAMRLRSE